MKHEEQSHLTSTFQYNMKISTCTVHQWQDNNTSNNSTQLPPEKGVDVDYWTNKTRSPEGMKAGIFSGVVTAINFPQSIMWQNNVRY